MESQIERVGKKWPVVGESDGWVFTKRFAAKWKTEVALKVFVEGGRVSDY